MDILDDFNTTVKKALYEIDPYWESYRGLIICGTHTPDYPESQIRLIELAREEGIPFLGICYGHQLAAIEYARNILGMKSATSEEWGHGKFVVRKRKEGLKVGLHDGETYWNNYEVDPSILHDFEKDKPAHFITTQAHTEYQSSIDKPHTLLIKFLEICRTSRK